jgi:CheY-like chemotaxis protein/HPt (histidine-containing phosphotransfer) domain-containing protein
MGFAEYAAKPIRHGELKAILAAALADREPTPRPAAARRTDATAPNRLADRNARILLAEDNITNQQVAVGILMKLGLRADAVANGLEVLKALETIPYDIVLMDVQMPEMDGLEAARRIRDSQSNVANHEIPIIAMTANAMQGDREECLKAGMNDYVTKPVSPAAVAETLDRWLPPESRDTTEPAARSAGGGTEDARGATPTPVFDKAGMLERLLGDEELAHTVAAAFLGDIPEQIAALRGHLKAGDAASANRQAHTIKGASANVGGEALRATALAMEMAAKAGDVSAAGARLPELEEQFDQLRQAIAEEL